MSETKAQYLAVVGPTASGKSALALRLAHELGGELINCDSVQLYRGFDIGSAKPSRAEQASVPHHLIDVLDWNEDFDARQFAEAARPLIAAVRARGKIPIFVGGTGLYLRALWQQQWHDLPKSETLRQELSELSTATLRERLEALDPERARVLHPNDRYRLQRALEIVSLLGHPLDQLAASKSERDQAFVVRLVCARSELHRRIAERTGTMLAAGLCEEVKGLLLQGVLPMAKPMQSIGYAQVVEVLQERASADALEESIVIATRQYAKRQETWFRKVTADLLWEEASDWSCSLHAIRQRLALPGA